MSSLARTFAYGSAVVAVVLALSLGGCSSTASDGGGAGSSGASAAAGKGGSEIGTAGAGDTTGTAGAGDTTGAGGAGDTTGAGGAGDTTGLGGADNGTAGADTSSDAGAGPTGGAVAKFCNEVQFGTSTDPMDITLRLEIGTAPNVVSISALSGTCVPLTGACSPIPVGAAVPVTLIDTMTGDTVLDSGTIMINEGSEYVFWAQVDTTLATPAPTIQGGSIPSGNPACSEFQYSDLPSN